MTTTPPPRTVQRADPAPAAFDVALAVGYVLLLMYGSLFPFSGWRWPQAGMAALLAEPMLERTSRLDVVFNGFIYFPLGVLLVRLTSGQRSFAGRVAMATAGGLALSFGMEFLQTFLPHRISSLRDLTVNGLGTFLGALLGWLAGARFGPAAGLRALRERLVRPGPQFTLGLWVVALWTMSAAAPLVPSPNWGNIRAGLRPIKALLAGTWQPHPMSALAFTLAVMAVATLGSTLLRPGMRPWGWAVALVAAVLALRIPVVNRQLNPEAVAGGVLGLAASAGLIRIREEPRLRLGAWLALFAVAADQLRPASGPGASRIDWMPFAGQISDPHGLLDMVGALWPYLAVAYAAVRLRLLTPWFMALGGAVAIGAFAFGLEALQAYVPGRYPDITDPLLAVGAWLLPWFHPAVRRAANPDVPVV